MSEQAKKQEESKDQANDTTKDKSKLKDEDDEVDEGYTCGGCWSGYCGCVVAICKVNNIINLFLVYV